MTANLVVTILVLPFMLHYFGPTKSGISDDSGKRSKPVEITLNFLERVIERHGTIVMGATMALFVVGFGFATQVQVSNDPLSYFRSDNRIRVDAVKLHEDLAGMQVFYLTVEAEPNKDFKDPDQLAKVAKVQRFMDTQGVYDKVISIADYMVLVNREMHQGDKAYYRIPETRELMEQYLLLFQRSDIERYINSDQTRINMLVRHNISDSWELNKYLAELDAKAAEVFGKTMTNSLTGKNLMINRAAETLFSSQVLSLGLLIGIIFIIMTALYTSITAGFLSLIPNLVPIAALFGVMGIFGIPLNPGTAIVAVIAVGIAIDDTIHMLITYNNECRKDPDQNLATQRAVRT